MKRLIIAVAAILTLGMNQSYASANGSLKSIIDEILERNQTNIKNEFTDLPENHWAYNEIMWMVSNDYMNGFPDGAFQPKKEITRSQFSFVLGNVLKVKSDVNVFDDVEDHWAAEKINGLIQNNIIIPKEYGCVRIHDNMLELKNNKKGIEDNTTRKIGMLGAHVKIVDDSKVCNFKPNENITRIEMAKMIGRTLVNRNPKYEVVLANLKELDKGDLPFKDSIELRSEEVPIIALVYGTGIMADNSGVEYDLMGDASRAEVASMVKRLLEIDKNPNSYRALNEFLEVAATGTNATTVSELVPMLDIYKNRFDIKSSRLSDFNESFKQGMFINDEILTAEIKRVYVLPYTGESIYKQKFMQHPKEYIVHRVHPNYWDESKHNGWIAAEVEVEFKEDVTREDLYQTVYGLNVWWAYTESITVFELETPTTSDFHLKGEKEKFVLYAFYNEKQGKVTFETEYGDRAYQLFNSNSVIK